MQEQLKALIERHCETIRQHVDAVGRQLELGCGLPEGKLQALAEAESLAHQLKGSSGSIGFPQVSAAATALDEHLKYLCAVGGAMTAREKDGLFRLYEELRTISAAISPQSSTLYPLSGSVDMPRSNTGLRQ